MSLQRSTISLLFGLLSLLGARAWGGTAAAPPPVGAPAFFNPAAPVLGFYVECARSFARILVPEPTLAKRPFFDPIQVRERSANPVAVAVPLNAEEVQVTETGSGTARTYMRTDRGLHDEYCLTQFCRSYVQGLEHLQGKRVLDVGTGGGKMVEDLRRDGVEAFGLDIHLSEAQHRKPYFIEASAEQTTLAGDQFDVILSSYSTLYYRHQDVDYTQRALRELARILKPGGEIRIDPANRMTIEKALQGMPELKLDPPSGERHELNGLEPVILRKIGSSFHFRH